jgi:hypothetical protein
MRGSLCGERGGYSPSFLIRVQKLEHAWLFRFGDTEENQKQITMADKQSLGESQHLEFTDLGLGSNRISPNNPPRINLKTALVFIVRSLYIRSRRC